MVRRQRPDIEHPLVRALPDIGRDNGGATALWLGDSESSIAVGEGLTGFDDGKAFIDRLRNWATSEPFRYRHLWAPDQLVIWDNRQVMHRGEYETVAAERGAALAIPTPRNCSWGPRKLIFTTVNPDGKYLLGPDKTPGGRNRARVQVGPGGV